jgi:Zn finger protein HypA/HybF involved in hydrogenase expression
MGRAMTDSDDRDKRDGVETGVCWFECEDCGVKGHMELYMTFRYCPQCGKEPVKKDDGQIE